MKRLILTLVLLLIANLVFSLTSTLIDFTKLGVDYTKDKETKPSENTLTLISFKDQAGSGFTDEQKKLMLTSLALDNWRVELASSAATVERQKSSFTREATTAANADPLNGDEMKNLKVLGVRVLFPESNFNSYAIVKPPFDIQPYQDKTTIAADGSSNPPAAADKGRGEMFNNIGVIKNVGAIKEIAVTVYGANYPHAVDIILEDQNYEQSTYHIAYLNFQGWGIRSWTNANYITEVRNREIKQIPLYPRSVPYVKLIGFIIYRDSNTLGGDFITYFKDVKITYDLAIPEASTQQIDDESIWGILSDRNAKRKDAEFKRMGSRHVLEFLEKQQMDVSTIAD